MKKPVLALEFEPDEYLCTWHVSDREGAVRHLHGSIEVAPMRPPRGVIYGQIPVASTTRGGETSFRFPQRQQATLVQATLANGGEVLLLDADIAWMMSHGRITGSAALLRRRNSNLPWETHDESELRDEVPSYPTFDRVRLQIESLDALLGFAPIDSTRFPTARADGERTWSAVARSDPPPRWVSGGDALEAFYRGSASISDVYSFAVRHSPLVMATPASPLSLRCLVDDWVEPMRAIASIATGRSESVTYLAVEGIGADAEESSRWQVFGHGISQNPFESNVEAVTNARTALACVADDVDLLNLVHKWQDLAAEHHPLIETYAAMLHANDQHPRSRFLLLVQSLEGMHGHETSTDFEAETAKHVQTRSEVLDAIKGEINQGHYKFIKKNLSRRPYRSLASALKATVQSLPVDRTDDLAAAVLVRRLVEEATEGASTFAAVARLRNLLAHGERGFDPSEVDEVVRVLEEVVRAHALRLLGCPDIVLKRVLEP
ncbi:hypothetical protein [uncultured Nocardioides sp.]|uniref:hypothetical protein n=1 Tax=uncultured Nocardioides sp. TaxID=198441 RepID=UPI0030F6BF62